MPEDKGIFPSLTVDENLRMSTHVGASLAEVRARTFAHFPRLRDRRGQLAGTLSGGEQRMLALSRALTTDPALVLLDQPTIGLAPALAEQLYERVEALAGLGLAILIVEQFAQSVIGFADSAAIKLHGRIVRRGRPDDIARELAAAYLGSAF